MATGLIAEAEAQPYLPLRAEVHHEVGRILSELSEMEQARPHHEQAARLAAQVGDDGLAASALLDLQRDTFYSERLAGRSGESALALDVYVGAAFQRVGRHDARYADYLMAAGELRLRLERYDEARPYFEAALQLLEGLFGEHDVRVADALVELATTLPPDRRAEQEESLARALSIYEEIRGPMHPSVGETLNRIGNLAEDPDEMAAAYDRALTIFADAFGPDDWQVGRALNNSAEGLCLRGDVERGLERVTRGLEIYEKSFGAEHCHLGYPLVAMGRCYLQGSRPEDAIAPLERALTICGGQSLHAALVPDIEFQLARALWSAHRDRARAVALARAARVGYQATEGRSQKELQEIDAWLAAPGEEPERRLAGR
jgi:tetratricopeptide (TPR) repeat protein